MKQDFRTKKQQTKFQQLHNIMTGQEHTLSGPISEKKKTKIIHLAFINIYNTLTSRLLTQYNSARKKLVPMTHKNLI